MLQKYFDKRIKRNNKYEFRSELHIEDVVLGQGDVETFVQINEQGDKETIYLFPNMRIHSYSSSSIFGASIKKKDIYKFQSLATRLFYINPSLDPKGLEKLTSYLVRSSAYYDYQEKTFDVKFEDLHPLVNQWYIAYKDMKCKPPILLGKSVLYSKNSRLSRAKKISITKKVHSLMEKKYLAGYIDMTVDFLIDTGDDRLAITDTRLVVQVNNEPAVNELFGTINKNKLKRVTSDDTKIKIKDYNSTAVFKIEKTQKKFVAYLEDKKLPLKDLSKKYNISKSTAVLFNKLRQHEQKLKLNK